MKKLFFLLILCFLSISLYASEALSFSSWAQTSVNVFKSDISKIPLFGFWVLVALIISLAIGVSLYDESTETNKNKKIISIELYITEIVIFIFGLVMFIIDPERIILIALLCGIPMAGFILGSFINYFSLLLEKNENSHTGGDMFR